MMLFAKIVNDCQPLLLLQKDSFYMFDWVLNAHP